MIAYQIVDFNNPVSVQYMEHSVKSFAPVSDVLTIVPVQCTVPSTIPADINLNRKKRAPTEQAALHSHYNLVKRLADGERFLVLEHDAYLWPDRVQLFRELVLNKACLPVWMVGIAVECYTVSQPVAQLFCEQIENDEKFGPRGPMANLFEAGNRYCKQDKGSEVLWPVSGCHNTLAYAQSCADASQGKGTTIDAPITQHVNEQIGVTINDRGKVPTRKTNPNVFWG